MSFKFISLIYKKRLFFNNLILALVFILKVSFNLINFRVKLANFAQLLFVILFIFYNLIFKSHSFTYLRKKLVRFCLKIRFFLLRTLLSFS